MKSNNIPYKNIDVLTPLIADYLSAKKEVSPFYSVLPNKNDLLKLASKKTAFSAKKRTVLVEQLLAQYQTLATNSKVISNINLLNQENTFTITTGHQLNFATGPLYTIYKIISTINAAEALSKSGNINVVPVFWLATEDHDFEEINHCTLFGNKIAWNTEAGNACGKLNTSPIAEVIEQEIKPLLNKFDNGQAIIDLLVDAYTNNTLASATIHLYNKLFGDKGLIILDADNQALKQLFAPIIKKELIERRSKKNVEHQNDQLNKLGYKSQAHARDINLFLLKNGIRERITYNNNNFELVNSKEVFSENEILNLLENSPEMFSPNVILRPLYQECILPNLAYIGGAGELAYWLQLKLVFENYAIDFPALLLRNAAVIIEKHQAEKMDKLNVDTEELFKNENALIANWTKKNSSIEINLNSQKQELNNTFNTIINKAEQIDPTLKASITGALSAQLKTIEGLEKKMLKAEKNKHEIALSQLSKLKNQLFPGGKLQERHNNIFEYVAKYGFEIIDEIKNQLNPFETAFTEIKL